MSSMPEEQTSAGKIAAEFTLPTTSGQSLSLTQARDGKKSVLFFWATWCPHCHEELERLRQNIETIKAKGINVLLINGGESKQEAAGYLKQQGIPLESFLDQNNDVSALYNVSGIPSLFFIDEKGVIRHHKYEFPNNYEELFQ